MSDSESHSNEDDVFLAGGKAGLTLAELGLEAKIGSLQAPLRHVLRRRAAARLAEEAGLNVAEDELETALSDFYAERELFEEEQIGAWRTANRLDEEDVRLWLRRELLADKLGEHLAPDEAIAKRFKAARRDYDRAGVAILRFSSPGAAAEVLLSLREGELTWERAVERAGGQEFIEYLRRDAPEEIAARLFTLVPGGLAGPVEDDEGGAVLYRLQTIAESRLDDSVRESLRDELVNEALARSFAADPPAFHR